MEILHGIYDLPQQKICLWQEGQKSLSKPDKLLLRGKSREAKLTLPTHNLNPLPSPIMAREYNIEIPNEIKLECHNIQCLYVDTVDIANTNRLLTRTFKS